MKVIKSKEMFEAMRKESRETPAVIMFTSPTCSACNLAKHVVEQSAADCLAGAYMIDVADSPELAVAQGIRNVPSLMIFSGGYPVSQMTGVSSAKDVRDFIEAVERPAK